MAIAPALIAAAPEALKAIFSFIDLHFQTQAEKDDAKLKALQMAQDGAFKVDDLASTNIQAEEKSEDKWTSRARPAFLYVIYIMILASIPMGILFSISPETSNNVISGLKGWLDAIPDALWQLFGIGYLGYVGARTGDKVFKWKYKQ